MTRPRWTRSRPDATTAPQQVVPGPRAPRTLRIPRVRRQILRDPIDQVAAAQLDRVLLDRRVLVDAAATVADTVLGRRLAPRALWEHVVRAATTALDDAATTLAPLAERAGRVLDPNTAHRCPRCSPAELCGRHQQVLWQWWDIRDARAVGVVNTVVAALAAGPPAEASPAGAAGARGGSRRGGRS